ncbi:hypothetical protein N9K75_02600 [bacterium]|nr:hypothetical protein [bacterium]
MNKTTAKNTAGEATKMVSSAAISQPYIITYSVIVGSNAEGSLTKKHLVERKHDARDLVDYAKKLKENSDTLWKFDFEGKTITAVNQRSDRAVQFSLAADPQTIKMRMNKLASSLLIKNEWDIGTVMGAEARAEHMFKMRNQKSNAGQAKLYEEMADTTLGEGSVFV